MPILVFRSALHWARARHRGRSGWCRSRASTPASSPIISGKKHRIVTIAIKHDQFEGIRITPNVYTTTSTRSMFSSMR